MVQRQLICRRYSFREARSMLGGLSHAVWWRERATGLDAPVPIRGRPCSPVDKAVLQFVRDKPGASRRHVAAVLQLPENGVRGALARHHLSRLNPRLRFTGLDPEADVPSDLLEARNRYKTPHQPYPGWLIHSAQKLLTRSVENGEQRRLHCFAVSDNFSSWATLHCASSKTPADAAEAPRDFIKDAPFPVRRVLSDHGSEFNGDFEPACTALRLEHRHTQPDHPYSNGKVERLLRSLREWNGTIHATQKRKGTWADITEALDHRCAQYNRSPYFGRNNRGLSPVLLIIAEGRLLPRSNGPLTSEGF